MTESHAAEITIEPFPQVNPWHFSFLHDSHLETLRALKVRLSGDIVPGDAEKLRKVVVDGLRTLNGESDPNWEPFPGRNLVVVSLDSPGGDFRTGIEIGNTIRALSLPTLVERDATCLSACAVAFMFGYMLVPEIYPERVRVLEAGGTLGFHRPFFAKVEGFDPSNFEGLAQADIDEIVSEEYGLFYDLANQLIQEMLATDPGAWSNDLLLRMLLAQKTDEGQNTFVYLDKVGQAIEWDIRVTNVAPPKIQCRQDLNREIWSLCYNKTFKELDYLRWEATGDYDTVRRGLKHVYDAIGEDSEYNYSVVVEGRNGKGCTISYGKDGTYAYVARGRDATSDLAPSEYFDPLGGTDVINLHKARTSLKDIALPANASPLSEQSLLARLSNKDLPVCPSVSSQAVTKPQCTLSNGGMTIRNETCILRTQTDAATGNIRVTYIWETGGETVVTNPGQQNSKIDGHRLERRYPKEDDNFQGFCALNFGTGNQFCYYP